MTSNPLTSALHEATTSLAELDFLDLSANQAPQVLHALSTLRNASDAALARCMRRAEAITPTVDPPVPPGTQRRLARADQIEDRVDTPSANVSSDTSSSNRFHPSQADFQTRLRPDASPALGRSGTCRASGHTSPIPLDLPTSEPTTTSWIAEATGRPESDVRATIDSLRLLDAEPETHFRYRSGHFTPTQAQALATVVEHAPDCIETALRLADQAEPEHLLAYAAHLRDPDDAAMVMTAPTMHPTLTAHRGPHRPLLRPIPEAIPLGHIA